MNLLVSVSTKELEVTQPKPGLKLLIICDNPVSSDLELGASTNYFA